ncbi:MAG: hypothetical protein GY862_29400 [Gammaproteobacteria bacterium]|nr:hypothetical protein [Gammaproteobacteria bacterium]
MKYIFLLLGVFWLPAAFCQWCTGEFTSLKEAVSTCGRAGGLEVERVYAIYKKMRNVADSRQASRKKLLVVNIADTPLARTLKDGIVLSRQAVEIAYTGVSQLVGDTRIAFILGHELAHLQYDMWRADAQTIHELTDGIPKPFDEYPHKKVELRADEHGFFYAAIAGYPVQTLLQTTNDFFSYWESHKPARVSHTHPEAKIRAKALRRRLDNLFKELVFFKYGVRLAYFGAYDDAHSFFTRFQETFEDPETLNNLGYLSLQRARQRMFRQLEKGDSRQIPYCLPVMLEIDSRAQYLVTPSPDSIMSAVRTERGHLDRETEDHLLEAREHLKRAVELAPNYLPARFNLAVTEFYLNEDGNLTEARQSLVNAGKIKKSHPYVIVLRALIMHEQGQTIDTWPDALAKLQSLPESVCVLYNLANLLEQRQRQSEAKPYWKKLAGQIHALPISMRKQVCLRTHCPKIKSPSTIIQTWDLPMLPGTRLEPLPKKLTAWKKILHKHKLDYGTVVSVYQSADESIEVMAINGYAKLVVTANNKMMPDALIQHCGQPIEKTKLLRYNLLRCRYWAGLLEKGLLKEVWFTE